MRGLQEVREAEERKTVIRYILCENNLFSIEQENKGKEYCMHDKVAVIDK